VLHWDGQAWARLPLEVDARDDAWAVGDGGTVLHWDGQAWARLPLEVDARVDLRRVYSDGQGCAWAVGAEGTILRGGAGTSAATAWHSMANPLTGTKIVLNAVVGVRGNTVWAAGERGNVLRYD
jgi:photosystem II stability/assembly factor-like uncharacterized protein